MVTVLTSGIYLWFVTFACLALSAGASSRQRLPLERHELLFSTGFFGCCGQQIRAGLAKE